MSTRVTPLPGGKYDIKYEDGSHYVGEMQNNRITGKGRLDYADGRVYEGYFDDGRWHGKGNAYFPSNRSRYEGDWVLNKREGNGKTTFYNEDGSVFAIHEGEYHNDVIDGNLRSEFFEDGTYFECKNSLDYAPRGPVHIKYGPKYFDTSLRGWTYSGFATYENSWYIRNGEGYLRSPEGVMYSGIFLDNKMDGSFVISYPDGRTENAVYSNGVKTGKNKIKDAETKKDLASHKNLFRPSSDDSYLHVKFKENDDYAKELKPYFKGIIGMDSVKDQLDRMYKRFRIDAMRKAQLGLNSAKQGYYFIITGNPGTGKTTVARIIGKMLRDLDILEGEDFVEVDRSRLVGQYIGHTAVQTSEVIQSARGGTLFIDEAYSLYRKDDDKDFGKEAIDTLLKDMEDHRGEYCCILAGYEDRMDEMIKYANPGLASRFDHKINIGDYSSEELLDIIVTMAESKYFFIKKEAKPVILDLFEKERIKPTFANARFARKILDEAIEAQALRLSDLLEERKGGVLNSKELQTLEASDFMDADGL